MHDADALLSFWIGDPGEDGSFDRSKTELWFGRSEDTDRQLRERFGGLYAAAVRGDLEGWARTPRGRLALVILLDQLSRNLHRGTAEAFAQDARALALAQTALVRGDPTVLRPVERVFLYLPFEHAEDRAAQRRAVALFEDLVREVAHEHAAPYETFLDYAVRHREIVDRFGRFPHRNEALGRETTEEEAAFLKQPGSSF